MEKTNLVTPSLACTDNLTEIPAPSVCYCTAPEMSKNNIFGQKTNNTDEGACVIQKKKKHCVTHNCDVRLFEVTAMK